MVYNAMNVIYIASQEVWVWVLSTARLMSWFFISFSVAPFMATYCSSKHALQVCIQDQNAVRQVLTHNG